MHKLIKFFLEKAVYIVLYLNENIKYWASLHFTINENKGGLDMLKESPTGKLKTKPVE